MFWGIEAGNGTLVFPRWNTIEHESGRNTQSRADRSLKYYNICYLRKSGKDFYNGHNVAKGGLRYEDELFVWCVYSLPAPVFVFPVTCHRHFFALDRWSGDTVCEREEKTS